jgi:hypothetical protein
VTSSAYRVGRPGGRDAQVVNFHIPSCGVVAASASWVVELVGRGGSGPGGSTPHASVVLAYAPDGWHVFGRYP